MKVLYDAANENAFQDEEVAEDELFNDDDDTADGEESAWGKSFKSNFSLDNQFMIQNTLTWSELLRKMKAEMKDISYAQIPKITTSRKIELNKPFNLVPDNFNATKGKKRSLLIGCNYRSLPGAELKASHDDVRSMKVSCCCHFHTFALARLNISLGSRTTSSMYMAFLRQKA